jgi:hypothetical protein
MSETDDKTEFDDVAEGEERSSLRMAMRAINAGWAVPPSVRQAVIKVATKILIDNGASHSARMRAVEAFLTMDRDNFDRLCRTIDLEAKQSLVGLNSNDRGLDARSEVEEILIMRVARLRKDNPDAAASLERVVDAGLRRLGLPPGTPAGDGPPPARPGP